MRPKNPDFGDCRWRAARPAALVAVLALVSGIGTLTVSGPSAAASTGPAATAAGCSKPVVTPAGPFTIQSDHRTVKDSEGDVYVPYGTTVPGLASPTYARDPASFVTNVVRLKDVPKINKNADAWCGNTVRLQVSQYNVTPNGSSCDTNFLDQALDAEVHAAEDDGTVAVINDTTESDPAGNTTEKDPTTATFTFWNCVSKHTEDWPGGVEYGQDPQVIFDVFNEPRADSCTGDDGRGPYDMNLWRNGGTFTGCGQTDVKYQGMDAVVYHIREDGATNLLWAEGPGNGNTLAGLTPGSGKSYLITDKLDRVVYSIHHPYVGSGAPANSTTWWREFGYLVDHPATDGVAPVVSGEWTNFTAATTDNPYCWPDAPTSVPDYLSYLQKLGVGLSAYQLSAGSLLKPNGQPTNYTDTSWKPGYCAYSPGTSNPRPPLLGAGADILAWFQARD